MWGHASEGGGSAAVDICKQALSQSGPFAKHDDTSPLPSLPMGHLFSHCNYSSNAHPVVLSTTLVSETNPSVEQWYHREVQTELRSSEIAFGLGTETDGFLSLEGGGTV